MYIKIFLLALISVVILQASPVPQSGEAPCTEKPCPKPCEGSPDPGKSHNGRPQAVGLFYFGFPILEAYERYWGYGCRGCGRLGGCGCGGHGGCGGSYTSEKPKEENEGPKGHYVWVPGSESTDNLQESSAGKYQVDDGDEEEEIEQSVIVVVEVPSKDPDEHRKRQRSRRRKDS